MTTLGNDVYACVQFGDIYKLSLSNTIRASADFTLSSYPDGSRKRIANTHATNTITVTMPSGYTMNGQSSFTIAPDTILEFEIIGTKWKCVSSEWEKIYTYTSSSGGGNVSQYKKLRLDFFTYKHEIQNSTIVNITDLQPVSNQRRVTYSCYYQLVNNTVYQGGGYLTINNSGDVIENVSYKYQNLSLHKIELYGMK